jgi:hypothetical protein
MQLILAIDSDPRRSDQLRNLVKARLTVDLVQASSAGEGLHALKDRIPDLILTAPLLSPFDDGVLDEYLRDLGAAATHVQTVRIPMLSAAPKKKSTATRLFGLGRKKKPTSSAAPDGCDPKVFADEISHYLTRSLEERAASAKSTADKSGISRAAAAEHAQVPDQILSSGYETFVDAGPEALVEEFSAPIAYEPAPIRTARVEDVHVPGAILDLRPPPVEVRKSEFIVEPEPQTFIAPEPQTFIAPEPQTFILPEAQTFVEPAAQTFVEPDPPFDFAQDTQALVEPNLQEFIEPDLQEFVEPIEEPLVEPEVPAVADSFAAVTLPEPVSAPAAPVTPTGTSPSFEAALAAIRAAWAKPEEKKPEVAPVAAAAEVDLTTEVDALEDVPSGTRRSLARRRFGDDDRVSV